VVEVFQSVDSGKRQVASGTSTPSLRWASTSRPAEVALDAAVRKLPKFGTAIDGLDISKVVPHHAEKLLHVLQTEMVHDHAVDFRRAFMLDRNTVKLLPVGRTKHPFS